MTCKITDQLFLEVFSVDLKGVEDSVETRRIMCFGLSFNLPQRHVQVRQQDRQDRVCIVRDVRLRKNRFVKFRILKTRIIGFLIAGQVQKNNQTFITLHYKQ